MTLVVVDDVITCAVVVIPRFYPRGNNRCVRSHPSFQSVIDPWANKKEKKMHLSFCTSYFVIKKLISRKKMYSLARENYYITYSNVFFFVKKKSIWTKKKTGTPHRSSGWTKLRYKLTRGFRVGVGSYVSSQRHAARNFDSVIGNPSTQMTDISSIPAPWYEQVYKWKWGTGITASFSDKCSSRGAISWERKTCSIVPIDLFASFLLTSKLPSFLLCLRSDIPLNLC